MEHIESIVVYNNEVVSTDYKRRYVRYIITLKSTHRTVSYEDLLHEKPLRTLVNYSKFDELLSYAYYYLLDTPKRGCGYHRKFKSVEDYHKWRNSIPLHEDDILWRINVHYKDGSFETAIFKDCGSTTSTVDRFENKVKRVLGMKHDQNVH